MADASQNTSAQVVKPVSRCCRDRFYAKQRPDSMLPPRPDDTSAPLPRRCPMRSGHVAPPPSAERLADGVVQSVNVVLAAAGCVVLGVLGGAHADPRRLAALIAYGVGLLAMVGTSALYAWARGGRRHSLYRHLDHAAIFLMIAGTYTPFIVTEMHGRWLLSLIWAVALIGILLKFVAPRRVDPLSVPLYLIMGWAGLSDPGLLLSLPTPVVTLLVAGGVFYTLGITFHLARVPFQEAIWHCFVLVAAACHYAAVVYVVA
jgi:hemolysin III